MKKFVVNIIENFQFNPRKVKSIADVFDSATEWNKEIASFDSREEAKSYLEKIEVCTLTYNSGSHAMATMAYIEEIEGDYDEALGEWDYRESNGIWDIAYEELPKEKEKEEEEKSE